MCFHFYWENTWGRAAGHTGSVFTSLRNCQFYEVVLPMPSPTGRAESSGDSMSPAPLPLVCLSIPAGVQGPSLGHCVTPRWAFFCECASVLSTFLCAVSVQGLCPFFIWVLGIRVFRCSPGDANKERSLGQHTVWPEQPSCSSGRPGCLRLNFSLDGSLLMEGRCPEAPVRHS